MLTVIVNSIERLIIVPYFPSTFIQLSQLTTMTMFVAHNKPR